MLDQIRDQIQQRGIHTVRLEFPDFFGILRGKSLPVSRFLQVLEEGVQFALPVFATDLSGNVAAGGGISDEVGYGDMVARPDLTTFGLVPWEEGTARVLTDLSFMGEPLEVSPRRVLQKVVAEYHKLNLEPIIASELEYYLCRRQAGKWVRYVDQVGMVYTSNRMTDPQDITGLLRKTLAEMGMPILASNHEFFPSQYEINMLHLPALEAADKAAMFKQALKETAYKLDLVPTFMAKPFNDQGGSGFHLHMSLRNMSTGKNAFFDPEATDGLAKLMRHFIAGQLTHASSTFSLMAPTVNSYKRYKLFSFAPYYILWGLDNRSTYVRVPNDRGEGTRVENRAADAAANPYLVIAGALAAGLDGIKRGLDPGDPFLGDAYQLADPSGCKVVPLSLGQALDALEKDKYLESILGKSFVKAYIALKRLEYQRFADYVTDWEFNEYVFNL